MIVFFKVKKNMSSLSIPTSPIETCQANINAGWKVLFEIRDVNGIAGFVIDITCPSKHRVHSSLCTSCPDGELKLLSWSRWLQAIDPKKSWIA